MKNNKTYEQGYINGFAQSKKKIEELENNWNELKEYLEKSWTESQDIWFVKIINKMKEIKEMNNLKEND